MSRNCVMEKGKQIDHYTTPKSPEEDFIILDGRDRILWIIIIPIAHRSIYFLMTKLVHILRFNCSIIAVFELNEVYDLILSLLLFP